MNDIWFISDTHFNHANILNFTRIDGSPLRPEFSNVDEMNETMIQNWNKVVKPYDKIYHLGDVGFGNENALGKILDRLMGKKRMLFGNHDKFDTKFYFKHFEKLHVEFRPARDHIFTHRPIHLNSDPFEKIKVNVHGHTHSNNVKVGTSQVDDKRYINISCEYTNYAPIHYETIKEMIRKCS